MNKRILRSIYVCMSVFLAFSVASCSSSEGEESKLVINEVLVNNVANFQDDYGQHSGWIEIFNKSYGSVNIAGCYIKVSSQPGDTSSYFIPKGDVLTVIKPRQHTLLWADGMPNRGTFHINCVLDTAKANWIGLYDSGKKLLDSITVPAKVLGADLSWARVNDGADEWEVKGTSDSKYVTPSTNNQTLDKNVKMDKFKEHDASGIGMAISAMSVVFLGLILLFILFKNIGKISIYLNKRNAMKAKGITCEKEAKENKLGEEQGEVIAAISMALHEMQNSDHDYEETVLTITRVKRSYSPWSSKIYSLRETPNRK